MSAKNPGNGKRALDSPVLVYWSSLVAQTVKNLPVMQVTRVQSLGLEEHSLP